MWQGQSSFFWPKGNSTTLLTSERDLACSKRESKSQKVAGDERGGETVELARLVVRVGTDGEGVAGGSCSTFDVFAETI
jgi:hypothetical protein